MARNADFIAAQVCPDGSQSGVVSDNARSFIAMPTKPHSVELMTVLGTLAGGAMLTALFMLWVLLDSWSPRVRTHFKLQGVEPVSAYTDPFIPDPATLPVCQRRGRCEPIPEALWPMLHSIRQTHFLSCPDGTQTRRLDPQGRNAYAQYRGLRAMASSRDQLLYVSAIWEQRRLGSPERGWEPWRLNGEGGGHRSEPLATFSRSSLLDWHEHVSPAMLPVDFTCGDLAQS